MQKKISIRLKPSESADDKIIRSFISQVVAIPEHAINGYYILNRSLDARGRQVWVNLNLLVFIDEPFQPRPLITLQLKQVSRAEKKVIIVGAGPAGLFAALKLLELGIQPIIIERGKDVRSRRRDLRSLRRAKSRTT
jgi:hypothetical protein